MNEVQFWIGINVHKHCWKAVFQNNLFWCKIIADFNLDSRTFAQCYVLPWIWTFKSFNLILHYFHFYFRSNIHLAALSFPSPPSHTEIKILNALAVQGLWNRSSSYGISCRNKIYIVACGSWKGRGNPFSYLFHHTDINITLEICRTKVAAFKGRKWCEEESRNIDWISLAKIRPWMDFVYFWISYLADKNRKLMAKLQFAPQQLELGKY